MSEATDLTAPLRAYLDASPSPWHAVATSAASLDAAGFVELDERQPWDDVPAAGYVDPWRRADRLAAARHRPTRGRSASSAPTPTRPACGSSRTRRRATAAGWRQLGVEVYGGVLLNSWLDRDLGVAGRALWPDGSSTLVRVDEPLARVPQLAIHLDRDVNERGLVLDRQAHLTPVWATDRDVGLRRLAGRRGRRRRAPRVVGAVPVRRPAGRRARRRPVVAGQRATRQPGVVLGGDDRARRRRHRPTTSP